MSKLRSSQKGEWRGYHRRSTRDEQRERVQAYSKAECEATPSLQCWKKILEIVLDVKWEFMLSISICINTIVVILRMETVPHLWYENYNFLDATRMLCYTIYLIDTLIRVAHRNVRKLRITQPHNIHPTICVSIDVISLIPTNLLYYLLLWDTTYDISSFFYINQLLRLYRIPLVAKQLEIGFEFNPVVAFLVGIFGIIFTILQVAEFVWLQVLGVWLSNDGFSWIAHVSTILDHRSSVQWYGFSLTAVLSMFFRYFTGTMRLTNNLERVMSIVLWLIGCVVEYSMVFGGLLPSLFSSHKIRFTYHDVSQALEYYLSIRDIRPEIGDRARAYYHELRDTNLRPPTLFDQLPLFLRKEILLDVFWNAFKHSNILSVRPIAVKRSLCMFMEHQYYMPGEILSSAGCTRDKMVYIVSGVVEVLAVEDNNTPVASFTAGTCLGEMTVCYQYVGYNTLRCATLCVVQILRSWDALFVFKDYPDSTSSMVRSLRRRMEHSRLLRQNMELMRPEEQHPLDEHAIPLGAIKWVKDTWRVFFEAQFSQRQGVVHRVTVKETTRHSSNTEAQPVAAAYDDEVSRVAHTRAFLDLFTLTDEAAKEKSSVVFAKSTMPWILEPHSDFILVWEFVLATVVCYECYVTPYCLSYLEEVPNWFLTLGIICDTVFIIDLYISVSTAVKDVEHSVSAILMHKLETLAFTLKLVASFPWHWVAILFTNQYNAFMFRFIRMVWAAKIQRWLYQWTGKMEPLTFIVKYVIYFITILYWLACWQHLFSCYHYICPGISWYTSFLQSELTFGFYKDDQDIRILDFLLYCTSIVLKTSYMNVSPLSLLDLMMHSIMILIGFLILCFWLAEFCSLQLLCNRGKRRFSDLIVRLEHYQQITMLSESVMKEVMRFLTFQWESNSGMDLPLEDRPRLTDIPRYLQRDLKESAREVVRAIPIFSSSDDEIVEELANAVTFFDCPIDTELVRAGDHACALFILRRGFCRCYSHWRPDVHRKLSWTLVAGDCFPLLEALHRVPSMLSVRCESACVVAMIEVYRLFKILEHFPDELNMVETLVKEHSVTWRLSEIPTEVPSQLLRPAPSRNDRISFLRRFLNFLGRRFKLKTVGSDESLAFEMMILSGVTSKKSRMKSGRKSTIKSKNNISGRGRGRGARNGHVSGRSSSTDIRSRSSSSSSSSSNNSDFNVADENDVLVEEEAEYERTWNETRTLKMFRRVLRRVAWDPTSDFVYCWELVHMVIALVAAMAHPTAYSAFIDSVIARAFCLALDAWCSVDIFVRLQVGYYNEKGILITHPALTVNHYLRNAFWVDLMSCFPVELLPIRYLFHVHDVAIFRFCLRLGRCLQLYRFCKLIDHVDARQAYRFLGGGVFKCVAIVWVVLNVVANALLFVHCDVRTEGDGYLYFEEVDTKCSWNTVLVETFLRDIITTPFQAYLVHMYYTIVLYTSSNDGLFQFHESGIILTLLIAGVSFFIRNWVIATVTSYMADVRWSLMNSRHHLELMLGFLQSEGVDERLINLAEKAFDYDWRRLRGLQLHHVCSKVPPLMQADVMYGRCAATLKLARPLQGAREFVLRELARNIQTELVNQGRAVVRTNDVQDRMFFLDSGYVEVIGAGNESLAVLREGAMFGNLARGTRTRHTCTMIARSDLIVFVLSNDYFYHMVDSSPEISSNLADLNVALWEYVPGITSLTMGDMRLVNEAKQEGEAITRDDVMAIYASGKSINRISGRMLDISKFIETGKLRSWVRKFFVYMVIPPCFTCVMLHMVIAEKVLFLVITIYTCDAIYVIKMITELWLLYRSLNIKSKERNREIIMERYIKHPFGFASDILSTLPFELFGYKWLLVNRLIRVITFVRYYSRIYSQLSVSLFSRWLRIFIALFLVIVVFVSLYILVRCDNGRHCEYLADPNNVHKSNFRVTTNTTTLLTVAIFFTLSRLTCASYSEPPIYMVSHLIFLIVFTSLLHILFIGVICYIACLFHSVRKRLCDFRLIVDQIDSCFKNLDVSPTLCKKVKKYMSNLWKDLKGHTVPQYLENAPRDLRIDLMSVMYGNYLLNDPVLSVAHTDLLLQLCGFLRRHVFLPGDIIAEKGDVDGCLYLLQRGEVKAVLKDKFFVERIVFKVPEGKLFASRSGLLETEPHQYTYRAGAKSTILSLDQKDWKYLFEYFPASEGALREKATEVPTDFYLLH